MGDITIKETAIKVLGALDNISSFASSIHPMFTVVLSMVRVARKGLMKNGPNPMEKDFQAIHDKLAIISKKNREALNDIRNNEVNETYGKHENNIKYQYDAFNTMMTEVIKNPDNSQKYIENFKNTYEKSQQDNSLDVFYRGVMGEGMMFGRPLLEGDHEIVESRCSHIRHLFHIGLIALIGYTAVTDDNEVVVCEKWSARMSEIQNKMDEALSKPGK